MIGPAQKIGGSACASSCRCRLATKGMETPVSMSLRGCRLRGIPEDDLVDVSGRGTETQEELLEGNPSRPGSVNVLQVRSGLREGVGKTNHPYDMMGATAWSPREALIAKPRVHTTLLWPAGATASMNLHV